MNQQSQQKREFVDYYELLQVSPNAEVDTIRKIFRMLAKKYHPDNPQSGNKEYFDLLAQAHKTLTEAELRAAYDAKYQTGRQEQWSLADEARQTAQASIDAATGKIDATTRNFDKTIRVKLLSLLYVALRRNITNPGMGELEIERILETPREQLDFHVWFLKEKGWIHKLDSGKFAITIEGVEALEGGSDESILREDRMLPATAGPSAHGDDRSLNAHNPRR